MERMKIMAVAIKESYQEILDEQNLEVRNMVLAGLDQVKNGNTKDFNEVCDRLEKKYSDAALHN
jgi:hypothetical protein